MVLINNKSSFSQKLKIIKGKKLKIKNYKGFNLINLPSDLKKISKKLQEHVKKIENEIVYWDQDVLNSKISIQCLMKHHSNLFELYQNRSLIESYFFLQN